jgi:hypothetical protein
MVRKVTERSGRRTVGGKTKILPESPFGRVFGARTGNVVLLLSCLYLHFNSMSVQPAYFSSRKLSPFALTG